MSGREDLVVGDAVQFRWEPGTGGVIRRVYVSWCEVVTRGGLRSVPLNGLRRVRPEHEARVRAAAKS